MPRKQREKSNSGIYHAMVRGINKQNIFFDDDDRMCMMRVLADAHLRKSPTGKVVSTNECQILAYALMPNHVHVLVKEGALDISEVMKKIQDRYVWFYNNKYDRCGHLFQDRFRSEPVDTDEYLLTLLRYIHRNPVKGMLCERPEDYLFSSWREFIDGGQSALVSVCDTEWVHSRHNAQEIITFVNRDVDDKCMDMDNERFVRTDQHAWTILSDISGENDPEAFKQLSLHLQFTYIQEAIVRGVSLRQASRLSTLSYSMIRKKMDAISSRKRTEGSDLHFETSQKSIQNSTRNEEESSPLEKVVSLLREDGGMHLQTIAERAELSLYATKKVMQLLVKTECIRAVPGKRWQWEVL